MQRFPAKQFKNDNFQNKPAAQAAGADSPPMKLHQ